MVICTAARVILVADPWWEVARRMVFQDLSQGSRLPCS